MVIASLVFNLSGKSIYLHMLFSLQLPERAIFKIKQYNSAICGVSEWHLEEAQVFWAKKEQGLALNILKQMIKKLDSSFKKVCAWFSWLVSCFHVIEKHFCASEYD